MSLVNINSIGDFSPSEKLEANLIAMFDWGFVHKGGYVNISPIIDSSGTAVDIPSGSGTDYHDFIGTSGWVEGSRSALVLSEDPRISNQAWQGPENWVYESGSIQVPGPFYEPIIYVDGIETTPSTISYTDGRVYFDTPIATNSSVRAKFSRKWVAFTSSQNTPYVRRIQQDDTYDFDIPETVLPLPFVAFDVPPITRSRYYGMGRTSARVFNHTISANVFADNRGDALKIADWICMQEAYSFQTFDPTLMFTADNAPLNYDGSLHSGKNFSELADLYPWVFFEILSAEAKNGTLGTQKIFHTVVTIKTQIIGCMT